MKRFIAILLLIVTAFYVLPCGNSVIKKYIAEVTCNDTNTDDGEETKKESGKEFVSAHIILLPKVIVLSKQITTPAYKPAMIYCAVFTPPPDSYIA